MKNHFKKIKELSQIGLADITASCISAIFWFYLATLIEPITYGEISFILSLANIVSTISLLGASQSLLVYSAKKIQIHSVLYTLNFIIGVISAIVVSLIIDNFSIGLIVMGYIIFAIAYTDLLGKKNFRAYSVYIVLQKVLMIIVSIGLFFAFGEKYIILGMALPFFIGCIPIFKTLKENKINLKIFKEKINFTMFNYAHTITATLHGTIDKILIGPLFGFTLLGNYSLGLQFFTLLMIIPLIFGKYLVPQDSMGNPNNKIKKIIIIISIGISILGFTIGPEVITFFFPKFFEVGNIIRIVSLGVIPSTITITFRSKFLGMEKGNYVLITGVIRTIIMIFSVIILGGLFQVEGVAMGIVLSATGASIFSFFMARRIKNG